VDAATRTDAHDIALVLAQPPLGPLLGHVPHDTGPVTAAGNDALRSKEAAARDIPVVAVKLDIRDARMNWLVF
jgi:hypothetical protein